MAGGFISCSTVWKVSVLKVWSAFVTHSDPMYAKILTKSSLFAILIDPVGVLRLKKKEGKTGSSSDFN